MEGSEILDHYYIGSFGRDRGEFSARDSSGSDCNRSYDFSRDPFRNQIQTADTILRSQLMGLNLDMDDGKLA